MNRKLVLTTLLSPILMTSQLMATENPVIGGSMTLNLGNEYFKFFEDYKQAPGNGFVYLDHFDGAYNHISPDTVSNGRHSPAAYPGSPISNAGGSWNGITLNINPTEKAPTDRAGLKNTTFLYDYDEQTGDWSTSGSIGLEGILRWKDDTDSVFALADYFVVYEGGEWLVKQSLWAETTEFRLDVQETIYTTDGFTISGELRIDPEMFSALKLMIIDFSPDSSTSFGTFSMTVQTIPEPSTLGLLSLAAGAVLIYRRKRKGI